MEKMICFALQRMMSMTQILSGKTVTDLRCCYKILEFGKVTVICEARNSPSLSSFHVHTHTKSSPTAIFWKHLSAHPQTTDTWFSSHSQEKWQMYTVIHRLYIGCCFLVCSSHQKDMLLRSKVVLFEIDSINLDWECKPKGRSLSRNFIYIYPLWNLIQMP